ncbi:hypothetical protein BDW_05250 [Bdellovibrio bacteriovorus W]|nr:hypothetical protein BDW_05250 [Bdellovibrio bacteriovorus W]
MSLMSKVFLFMFFAASVSEAAPQTMRIHSSRSITSHVDRFYDKVQNAFATIFCREDAAQVMIVDSRMTDLDGKNFYFSSEDECNKARSDARMQSARCQVTLSVDLKSQKAKVKVEQCR